jgi:endonuclease YncB( thermonuclease family)
MPRTFDFPNALVERSVDGDSHDVTVFWEMPFFVGAVPMPIRLRIAGIDCEPGGPDAGKKRTALGEAAYVRARELVEGKRLHVVTYEPYAYRGPDRRLGEWVGDVEVRQFAGAPVWLSALLLAEGLAVPYDGKGKRPSAAIRGAVTTAETADGA